MTTSRMDREIRLTRLMVSAELRTGATTIKQYNARFVEVRENLKQREDPAFELLEYVHAITLKRSPITYAIYTPG